MNKAKAFQEQGNPLRVLAAVILFSTVALLTLLWTIYNDNHRHKNQQKQLLIIQAMRGDILYYDGLITNAARMAVLTENAVWRDRYETYKKEMENSFNELRNLAPEILEEVAEKVNSANDRLLDLQTSAFLLLDASLPKEALDLLIGHEYQQYKDIFQRNLELIDSELARLILAEQIQAQKSLIQHLAMAVVLMVLVFIAWCASWFILRNWRTTIRKAALEREEMLKELAELNTITSKSKSQLEAVIQSSVDGILTLSKEGLVKSSNTAAQNIFQKEEADIFTLPIETLIPGIKNALPEQNSSCVIENYFLEFGKERKEFSVTVAENLEVFIEVTVSKTKLEESESYVLTIRDLSLKKMAEQAEKERETARRQSEAKSEFLANMSHEIRTPMNGVIGMTDILLRTKMSPEQEDYARTIRKSADALQSVINDILDFSKIDQGALTLEPISFNLHNMVDDVGDVFSSTAEGKNLGLMVNFTPGIPEHVVGDPGRIRQILNNLVNNALKFTKEGYVLINVEQLDQTDLTTLLKFSITDTGVGIKEEALASIFDRFTQEDSSTTRRFGGTGLGLAICKQLAELMDGCIGVESAPEKGSTFWFELPLEIDWVAIEEEHKREKEGSSLEGVSILVVEDNEINAKILETNLAYFGAMCTCVNSAEAAWGLLEEKGNTFSIAVFDQKLPGMSGLELATRLKAENKVPDLKLIACTSIIHTKSSKKFEEAGFAGYLTKPLKTKLLQSMLLAVLNRESVGHGKMITRYTLRSSETQVEELALTKELKILIAEDDLVNQKVAMNLITNVGCTATVASNGAEAFAHFKNGQFDLVLMDMQMPEMDGVTATTHIRTYEKEEGQKPTPIIAFTANATEKDKEKCYYAGMNDFMTKPINMDKFQQCLQKWIFKTEADADRSVEDDVTEEELAIAEVENQPVAAAEEVKEPVLQPVEEVEQENNQTVTATTPAIVSAEDLVHSLMAGGGEIAQTSETPPIPASAPASPVVESANTPVAEEVMPQKLEEPQPMPTPTSAEPEEPAIDFEYLQAIIGDDADLKADLFEAFKTGAEEAMVRLEACTTVEDEDWCKAAHKLKGSAINLGMNPIGKVCAVAENFPEQLTKEEHLQAIQKEYARILSAMNSA